MTTIITQDTVFAAVDHLWTDEADRPALAPFKKFYVLNDSILFFSGYIDPILAVLAGYIGDRLGIDEEFAEWMAKAAEMDGRTCEVIEVERETGSVVYYQGAVRREELDFIFYGAGSGSDYALDSYLSGVGIIQESGNSYDFLLHGENLIHTSMMNAFRRDVCSGGDFSFIAWDNYCLLKDQLGWVETSQLDDYNNCIMTKITEHFGTKKELIELVSQIADEQIEDEKEMEIEAKIFDQSDNRGYSPQTNLAAKGRNTMSNTTQQKPRVAVKTSGSERGTVLSASSLKARLAQRKAQGLS